MHTPTQPNTKVDHTLLDRAPASWTQRIPALRGLRGAIIADMPYLADETSIAPFLRLYMVDVGDHETDVSGVFCSDTDIVLSTEGVRLLRDCCEEWLKRFDMKATDYEIPECDGGDVEDGCV